MKKVIFGFVCLAFLSSCFIFRKKEKYGCPSDGRNVGAEKLLSDEKAMKKSSKAKFRGGKTSY